MNKTLLILAGGMGSRFGGLKQIEPVGPNGEFIIDYSIYDAVKSGFNKVVFLIKKENYEIFRNTIGKRFENIVKVEYAFQENKLPNGFILPESRVKPLGTAHAIMCAKDVINEPFVIINADDFYGRESFENISKFMDTNDKDYALVGYNVKNTLSENGSVKRGVCVIQNNELKSIIESKIIDDGGIIECERLDDGRIFYIDDTSKVSMNMILFRPNIFKYIEDNFIDFLNNSDLEKDEYLIPNVLQKAIKEGFCKVKIVDTNAKWVGVTYKEDKDSVVKYIDNLIKNGDYNAKL